MTCRNCSSTRLNKISGKCSDMVSTHRKDTGEDTEGEVPEEFGGGDYITFTYCLDCGAIQGNFPIADRVPEEDEDY